MEKINELLMNKKNSARKDEKAIRKMLCKVIRLQAMYSDGKIKFIETSSSIN